MEDERFQVLENEKSQAKTSVDATYNDLISKSQDFYQQQQTKLEESKAKQESVANEQLKFQEETLKQDDEKAVKQADELKASTYGEYRNTSDRFGVEAERLAEQGFSRSGVAQSTQTNLYQSYMTRKAEISKNLNDTILEYKKQFNEAKLINNVKLAEIYTDTLEKSSALALQAFNQNNQLILNRQSELRSLDDNYYNRKQNLQAQIEREEEVKRRVAELEESKRQYQEQIQLEREKLSLNRQQTQAEINRINAQTKQLLMEIEKNNESKYYSPLNNESVISANNSKSVKEVLEKMTVLQGPNLVKPIKDGYSNKTFKSVDELLNYYGYAVTK